MFSSVALFWKRRSKYSQLSCQLIGSGLYLTDFFWTSASPDTGGVDVVKSWKLWHLGG